MLKRHESCIGLSLPAIGRFKLEVWWCPSGFKIKPHVHDNVSIESLFVMGSGSYVCRKPEGELFAEQHKLRALRDFGRSFSIPAGCVHWFEVGKWPLLFINFEWWKSGVKPSSASDDFKEKV